MSALPKQRGIKTVEQYLIATAHPVRRAELIAELRHAEAMQREAKKHAPAQPREQVWRRP